MTRKLLLILPLLCTLTGVSHGEAELPDAPIPQASTQAPNPAPPATTTLPGQEQPQRILGVVPNFNAVSAGSIPPPPGPKQSFLLATKTSFDPVSVFFIGVTSLIAEGENVHPQLGKGPAGFYGYFWRGFADKTDGNYLVLFAYPALLHEDPRYFAMGQGSFAKRIEHSTSSIVIAHNYHGQNTFNAAEILGRGTAQAIGTTYYPASDRTVGAVTEKFAFALMRDALTNTLREFWPDIATHILHRPPAKD